MTKRGCKVNVAGALFPPREGRTVSAKEPSMRLVPTLAAAATLILASVGGAALACSCVAFRSAAEHLATADVVFKGRVVAGASGPSGPARSSFRVLEVLKGRATGTVVVHHQLDSAACGVTFRPGKSVWIFAHRAPDGSLRTGSCSMARFSEEEYRRAALGRSVPISPPVM
jgi:hypothetical protein